MHEEIPAEDLLVRVAQHDVGALGELYDRYAPRLYGLMTHILASSDDAERILQEVFLRLWSDSASISQKGTSVVAWLVVTSRETAVDRLRALRKDAPGAGPLIPKGMASRKSSGSAAKSQAEAVGASSGRSAAKSPASKTGAVKPMPAGAMKASVIASVPSAWLPLPREITLIDDRMGLLQKVISHLPAFQRQALELAVFGGLDESQIAEQLGEPLGRVRTALRAAVTFVKHRRQAVCGSWVANI